MKFLVLITARAGSRRLKNKNLLKLNKKSLLYIGQSVMQKKLKKIKKLLLAQTQKKYLMLQTSVVLIQNG